MKAPFSPPFSPPFSASDVMNDGIRAGIHGALLASMAPAARRFDRARLDPQGAQRAAWRGAQKSLRGTLVARRYTGLLRIEDPAALRDVAPVVDYDDIADDIHAAAAGAVGVRSASPIERFERSGGSSGAQKLLPLTKAFLGEMQQGLSAWLFDLYRHTPALLTTSAYWSISPIGQKASRTSGGIVIGADDDVSYLPGPLRGLMRRVMAAPQALARFPDVDSCRYATLRTLIERPDLGLISVWSPTFLTLLLDGLQAHGAKLLDDLAEGTCRPPGADATVAAVAQTLPVQRQRRRADRLRRHLHQAGHLDPQQVWPRLHHLSMWCDGESARFAAAVASRLPGAVVQPKGLLATEGIISIPITGAIAPVLAATSHVYEFIDGDGRIKMPHELAVGDVVEVLLTTSSGLLRYRLGDRVEVMGHLDRLPCLRFLGRVATTCDLVGEKVSSALATTVLERAAAEVQRPRFSLLVPRRDVGAVGYVVYVDGLDDVAAAAFAGAVEDGLAEGHPYRYARALGQLAPVRAVRSTDGLDRFERWRIQQGQRAGDIKIPSLCLDDDVHAVLGQTGATAATAAIPVAAPPARPHITSSASPHQHKDQPCP
jgi:hypothetical protein